MPVSLVPVGPSIADPAVRAALKSHEDALLELMQPSAPSRLHHIDTKANLPTASDWPECAVICDEINSIVVSTLITGVWTWTRADGGSL